MVRKNQSVAVESDLAVEGFAHSERGWHTYCFELLSCCRANAKANCNTNRHRLLGATVDQKRLFELDVDVIVLI